MNTWPRCSYRESHSLAQGIKGGGIEEVESAFFCVLCLLDMIHLDFRLAHHHQGFWHDLGKWTSVSWVHDKAYLGSVLIPVTVSKQLSSFWNKAFTNHHHPLLQVTGQFGLATRFLRARIFQTGIQKLALQEHHWGTERGG